MASLGEDLLGTVNKLQDLVFNTIGNDSLDLPQIVSNIWKSKRAVTTIPNHISGRSWITIIREIIGIGKYSWT